MFRLVDSFQVQCLGRQILEALLFLRSKHFPSFYHLHSGNVIIQNGVARLAGLENCLFGLEPRQPIVIDVVAFGYLLFEITNGYELPSPPTLAHIQLELERVPKVAEVIQLIFQSAIHPSIEELLYCDLFRGVELRELRGTPGVNNLYSANIAEMLETIMKPPLSPKR